VDRRRGLDVVRHSGALMGFRADLVRYPRERFSVITLCNHGAIDAAALADQVTDLFLRHRMEAVPPRPRPVAGREPAAAAAEAPPRPSAAELGAMAGRYHSTELDVTYVLDATPDGLRVTRRAAPTRPLIPTAADRFTAAGQVYTFQRDRHGRVTGFLIDAGRVRNIHFERLLDSGGGNR
jgi:hypothetical protein